MPNTSRPWVLIGLIGLMVIGGVLIAVPLLTSTANPIAPTPIPTALNLDPSVPYPDVPRVTVAEAHAAYESQQAVFIDVRSAGQYTQSHIPGAKSIPLNELESRLNELNKEQGIITYCT